MYTNPGNFIYTNDNDDLLTEKITYQVGSF